MFRDFRAKDFPRPLQKFDARVPVSRRLHAKLLFRLEDERLRRRVRVHHRVCTLAVAVTITGAMTEILSLIHI